MQRLPKEQHLVAVDLVGHGSSSLPAPGNKPPSALYMTETLHEVKKRLLHSITTSTNIIHSECDNRKPSYTASVR